MKKESLSIMTVKILLAVVIFAGIGVIIIGGGYIVWEYSKCATNNQITKPINQETENYYDILEKKCAGDNCCISSLKTMRENNYKEADESGKCPEGFFMNMMKCITSYRWCVPIKEIEWESCNQDNDCEARFSHCDCRYHCVNKNIETVDCAVECDTIGPILPKCVCENNECVENQPDTSDGQTYRNEEFGFEVKYPKDFTKQETVSDNSMLYLKRAENGSNIFMNINIKRNYQVNYFEAEEIKIGDRIGYKYFYQEGVGYSGVVLIQLDQDALELTYDFIGYYKDKKISKEAFVENNFNQILSTFKFIKKDDTSDWQTYRNEEFGFEVKYPESDNFGEYKVEQINDIFYIAYDNYDDITGGQFVKIFTKDRKDGLKQAIEKKFLKNFTEEECFVSEKDINYLYKYPESYIVLSAIDYPNGEEYPLENKNNCPYAIFNGKSYFLMDSNHPDRFAFFSIGQYSIPVALEGVEIFWQDTFKFIEN
ncbi:hypothetical protein KAI56_03445 [Candidatus Parcubacteria bacterium]|nr:hypothetical protein [Candidatus Parcubacteria bacterium]